MQGTVDGDHVTLTKHLFQAVHTSAPDLFLNLWLQGLIIKIEKLFALEWFESAEDPFADASNSNCADDLALQVIFVLGCAGDVPISSLNLLVGRNKIPDEVEDGHDDVLGNGDSFDPVTSATVIPPLTSFAAFRST
jgi:hypothetical protein